MASKPFPFSVCKACCNGGSGDGGSIVIDDNLDETSENPVQNKVIAQKLGDIETILSEIEALQNSYIGGDGV